jgi:hypothetical protein
VQRILRGTAATLRSTKLNSEGEAVAPSGAVTVEVTRWDGSVVIEAGTATGVDGNDRTIALTPAQTAELDHLAATWTDTDGSTWTTTAEIVGGFYFSIAEARASDKTLEDPVKYPAADILTTRTEVEEEFEEICGRAFVPRFGTFTGTGGAQVLPDPHLRKLRSVSVDGTAYTAAELEDVKTDEAGIIATTARRGAKVVVSYEHGLDSPPADLKRAALTRLRSRLNMDKSAVFDRTISFSAAEGGTYRLATPSARHTGIPDVDAVLDRYALRTPTVA